MSHNSDDGEEDEIEGLRHTVWRNQLLIDYITEEIDRSSLRLILTVLQAVSTGFFLVSIGTAVGITLGALSISAAIDVLQLAVLLHVGMLFGGIGFFSLLGTATRLSIEADQHEETLVGKPFYIVNPLRRNLSQTPGKLTFDADDDADLDQERFDDR